MTRLDDLLDAAKTGALRDDELRELTTLVVIERTAHINAVRYTLDRSQTDPDLGYLIGPGTQTFELLTIAESIVRGATLEEVKRKRARDLQPEYAKRRPEVVARRERMNELASILEDHGIQYPVTKW